MKKNEAEDTLPLVSFVIPNMNDARNLERCLKSIISQQYPKLEVIVVDGGSKDGSFEIASKYADVVLRRNGTVGYARQAGVRVSKGEVLGIFDSDIYLPHEKWLFHAIQPLIKDKGVGIVWPINTPPRGSPAVTRSYFNFCQTRAKRPDALPGGNVLILREAFDKVGGFNINLHGGEDMDLSFRIAWKGYKVVRHEDPIIHDTMVRLREFTRKEIIRAATMTDYKERGSKINLLYACMTYRLMPVQQTSSRDIIKGALDHIITALKSMVYGLKKDRANWMIPLLLLIRLFVYGLYYFKILRFTILYPST